VIRFCVCVCACVRACPTYWPEPLPTLTLRLGLYVLTNVPTQLNGYDITWFVRGWGRAEGVLAIAIKTSAATSSPSLSSGEKQILHNQPLQIAGTCCLWGAKQDTAESNDKHHSTGKRTINTTFHSLIVDACWGKQSDFSLPKSRPNSIPCGWSVAYGNMRKSAMWYILCQQSGCEHGSGSDYSVVAHPFPVFGAFGGIVGWEARCVGCWLVKN